jgi:GNAT superfamily N-acetyltransferase
VRYQPWLDRDRVAIASTHNHPRWGGRRTVEEHTAHAFAQLERAGPELLRYVGMSDARGELISAAKRYALWLRRPDGAPVRTVGIGAVFTRVDARRRGAASALVRAILGEARDLGYGAALLYSDIDVGFYERHGFVTLPALDRHARVDALPNAGAFELRGAEARDEQRLAGWYDASWDGAASSWLRSIRTPASWRYFKWRNRIPAAWLMQERGAAVGYLIASLDDHPGPDEDRSLWVEEWSAPGQPRERVLATLRLLAIRDGAAMVRGSLRPDHGAEPFESKPRPMAIPMVATLVPGWSPSPDAAHFGSYEHF